ncbi:hypothetical protein SESBI_42452, partial [Sesbania bispinosa]
MTAKQRVNLAEKLLKKQALEAKKEEAAANLELVQGVDPGKTKRQRLTHPGSTYSGPKINDAPFFKPTETTPSENQSKGSSSSQLSPDGKGKAHIE